MKFNVTVTLLLLLAGLAATTARANDASIVAEAVLIDRADRIEVHGHRIDAIDGLAAQAADALATMERTLGRTLDTETLGPTLRIYVSPTTRVSHVWRGYHHKDDPQPMLFINPKIARLGIAGRDATYAHELAHLLTWRFHSHTLREGLADYLALQVHPDAVVGPNKAPSDGTTAVPEDVQAHLLTTRPPPEALGNDPQFRAAYYDASQRLVRHLVERGGMATFLQLYDDPDPEVAIERLYGTTRADVLRAALG